MRMSDVSAEQQQWENHFSPQRTLRCFSHRPHSLHSLLEHAVLSQPDRTALVCGNTRLSYRELNLQVGQLAAGWHTLGVRTGDRIALLLSNRIEFVLCLMAAARLGAVTVPLTIREQTPGLHYMLSDCAAVMLVHDAALSSVVPAKETLPDVRWQVSVENYPQSIDLYSLMPSTPLSKVATVSEEDTAVILYTSGTTGKPKGAMLSHLGIVHSCIHYQLGMGLD